MCGRFTLTFPGHEELARLLGVSPTDALALLYRPRWNVAPTDPHWVVRIGPAGGREIAPATWGFTPLPAANGARRGPLINARSETARRMPGVREAFADRRCIVPVDGFYEWVGDAKARRPIWFHPAEAGVLRLAGLWAPSETGARFTLLTTAANDVVAPVHDRMPVVIAPGDEGVWLGSDAEGAARLLAPAPGGALIATAVAPRANSVKNDDARNLEPWDPTLEIDLRDAVGPAAPRPRRAANGALPLFAQAPAHEGDAADAPRPRGARSRRR